MSIVSSFALSRCFAYSPGLWVFCCHEQSVWGHVVTAGKNLDGYGQEKRVAPELRHVLLTIFSHCCLVKKLTTAEFGSQI